MRDVRDLNWNRVLNGYEVQLSTNNRRAFFGLLFGGFNIGGYSSGNVGTIKAVNEMFK